MIYKLSVAWKRNLNRVNFEEIGYITYAVCKFAMIAIIDLRATSYKFKNFLN